MSAWVDGAPATVDDLRSLAASNYGHFTSLQVRGGAVRGLDLHLRRLSAATRELFDAELGEGRVRGAIRAALDGAGAVDASVRVTVFARDFDHRRPECARDLGVLVALSPPRDMDGAALRVRTCRFERPLAHLKHVGTFPLFELGRQARRDGFDDALFVDADGRVSEGTVWNVGFWDGPEVVWPQAAALRGTTERLLQDALRREGVAQRWQEVRLSDLPGFRAAFAANSAGIRAIRAIDGLDYGVAEPEALAGRLRALFRGCPMQPLRAGAAGE